MPRRTKPKKKQCAWFWLPASRADWKHEDGQPTDPETYVTAAYLQRIASSLETSASHLDTFVKNHNSPIRR